MNFAICLRLSKAPGVDVDSELSDIAVIYHYIASTGVIRKNR
jgi:hypothetical protein